MDFDSRWDYVVDALYYALSLTLSYLLMLVFMTYNVGFCITVSLLPCMHALLDFHPHCFLIATVSLSCL